MHSHTNTQASQAQFSGAHSYYDPGDAEREEIQAKTAKFVTTGTGALKANGRRCQAARQARSDAATFAQEGCVVLVIGPPRRADGAAGELSGLDRVTSADAARRVHVASPQKVAYVVEPGCRPGEVAAIVRVLRERFPRLRGQHPASWCYAEADWNASFQSAALECDLLLVVGEASYSGIDMSTAPAGRPLDVRLIPNAAGLKSGWLAEAATVAVIQACSTSRENLQGVIEVLSGLGPMSLVRRQVVTEHLDTMHFSGRSPLPVAPQHAKSLMECNSLLGECGSFASLNKKMDLCPYDKGPASGVSGRSVVARQALGYPHSAP
ncbi:hypothetical protein [Streptomyces lavendulocolor]|uniref:hypothetical protein n=1 Tax=Streptomyces lavendulocolor TaxID=67316 RepID=UPI0033C0A30F